MAKAIQNVLDLLRQSFPQTYTLLHRPALGQGGFQDRIRRMQRELGIVPNEVADHVTPAALSTRQNVLRTAADDAMTTRAGRTLPPLPVTEAELTREHATLQAAKLLRQAGDHDGATRLLESLVGETATAATEPRRGRQAEPAIDVDEDSDDDAVDVANLDAVLNKARKVRTEKATMRAMGRSRKSPKLTERSRAARTYRMLQLHHDTRTANRRMAEKFGADWKKLIK